MPGGVTGEDAASKDDMLREDAVAESVCGASNAGTGVVAPFDRCAVGVEAPFTSSLSGELFRLSDLVGAYRTGEHGFVFGSISPT